VRKFGELKGSCKFSSSHHPKNQISSSLSGVGKLTR
jgi:hypothetical protein